MEKPVKITTQILFLTLASAFLAFFSTGCVVAQAENSITQTTSDEISSPVIVAPNIPQATANHPAAYPTASFPVITAPVVIVMDPASKEILFEKNARERRAVASTQKLLTAIVALENAADRTVATPLAATKLEPSKLYLREGAEYPIKLLLKSLLVKSANDVAYTIAHGTAGSFEGFVDMMNVRAKSLGMHDSHFKNASGLTLEGQYSTAYDIAIAASYAYKNPYIRECISTRSMTFNHIDGRVKTLTNTNKLLTSVPYCTGMKTGTTRASGYCLVSSGELNGRTMIVGVFGANSKASLLKDSEAILRWSLER